MTEKSNDNAVVQAGHGSSGSFVDLGVAPVLAEALRLRQISEPFEIQSQVLPEALVGRDILGRAPTGSGKTVAFGLPALQRVMALPQADARRPRALILSPTRELAEQIAQELDPLARAVKRRVLAVYGGASIVKHRKALDRGIDLLVACPGRLIDLINQGAVALDEVELAVVDEADRMADMGFLPDVRTLLDQSQAEQTLLFSATLDGDVDVLVRRYQNDPVVCEVGEPEPDLSLVDHRFIEVPKRDRVAVAADLIDQAGPTVVFVRTRHGADRVARQLRAQGITAGYLHGGRSQSQRDRALQVFTDGKVQTLVATDVAARGIHVDGVACVIHFDPPAEIKDYVHRSGRTARAGATGVVVSLLDPPQVKASRQMQRELGIEAKVEPRPEPVDRDREPVKVGADRGGSGGRASAKGNRSSYKGSRPAKGNSVRPAKAKAKAEAKAGRPANAGALRTEDDSSQSDRSRGNSNSRKSSSRKTSVQGSSGQGSSGSRSSTNKPSAKKTSNKKTSAKRDESRGPNKPGKRTGKPRPKNRKNKSSFRRGAN